MTAMLLSVDPGGFSLRRDEPVLGLLSVIDLPFDVTVLVDLDEPERVFGVMGNAFGPGRYVLEALIGAEAVAAVARAQDDTSDDDFDAPDDDVGDVVETQLDVDSEAASAYLRLALVRGVQQWAQLPLDEDVLACDCAVACADAGLVDRAEALAVEGSAGLVEMAEAVLADSRTPIATFVELVSVAEGTADLLPDSLVDVANRLRRLALEANYRVAAFLAGGRAKWDHSVLVSAGAESHVAEKSLRRYHVDRAQVPARVLAVAPFDIAEIDVDGRGNAITVRAPAFATLRAADPAATMMFARLVASDGTTFSSGQLRLVDGRFTGSVPLYGRPVDEFEIDVFHGASASRPRFGTAGAEEKRALSVAQDAFTGERLALTTWAMSGSPDDVRAILSSVRDAVARVPLDGAPDRARRVREAAIANRINVADNGDAPWDEISDIIRPTLAELSMHVVLRRGTG